MKKQQISVKISLLIGFLAITPHVFSFTLKEQLTHGHAVVQLGNYWSIQGKSQHVNINTLIGDNFTINSNHSNNGLVGIGYFIDGQEQDLFKLAYGVNGFFLAKTGVSGTVVQEDLLYNLSYDYKVTHYPVYAVARSTIKTKSPQYSFTFDLGLGPNFMHTDGFKESSLDDSTLPDDAFGARTTTTFSAMTGLGVKINNFFGTAPLECGYKFFYLGQGKLAKKSNQLASDLKTGSSFANAVMCSITV